MTLRRMMVWIAAFGLRHDHEQPCFHTHSAGTGAPHFVGYCRESCTACTFPDWPAPCPHRAVLRSRSRGHVFTELAGSNMVCDLCRQRVDGIHDEILCGCESGDWVAPCKHPLPEHLQDQGKT